MKDKTNLYLIGICSTLLLLSAIPFLKETIVFAETAATIPEISKEEMDCLATNVYFEARNQSIAGQKAVALVTLNRVNDSRYPSSICKVTKQKTVHNDRTVCQFSWFCNGKSNTPLKNSAAWVVAQQAARDAYIMYHTGFDITDGSTHFHATYVNPSWSKSLTKTVHIDDHIFYKSEIM